MGLFFDRGIWRRALAQGALVLLLAMALGAAGQLWGTPVRRWLAGTPEPLLAACAALGASPERALVTGWTEAERAASPSPAELSAVAHRALECLQGADLLQEVVEQEPVGGEGVELLAKSGDGGFYRVSIRIVGSATGGPVKLYLVASAELKAPRAIEAVRERVRRSLHTLGRAARLQEPVYATVHCRLPAVLTAEECAAESRRIMSRLRCTELEVLDGQGFYSVLGHTALFSGEVAVAGQKVNFALALRPDPGSGCTWVVVGTPLCAGDY